VSEIAAALVTRVTGWLGRAVGLLRHVHGGADHDAARGYIGAGVDSRGSRRPPGRRLPPKL